MSRFRIRVAFWLALVASALSREAAIRADEATISIQADRVLHPSSKYLTGSCIEDVNHEIYGGLYSQMIFGESFQEPALLVPQGFTALGGQWAVRNDELHARGIRGDKLISELPEFANGEVGVEIFVPDDTLTNAGLIVRVGRARKGMDTFDGYEISLNAATQHLLLGRHRQNWEPIQSVPCAIPLGQWVPLVVKLHERTLEVSVNGQPILKHEDDERALLSGTIGLRQFQPEAKYRNLWVKTGSEVQKLPFRSATTDTTEVSGMWRAVQSGDAHGKYQLETENPFLGSQSQRLTFQGGTGSIGIENQGLNRWGLHFEASQPYEGVLWAKSPKATEVIVSLQSRDGTRTVAESHLVLPAGDWQRLTFTLIPNAAVPLGRFVVSLRQPGSVVLGYASLQPGEWGRYRGLPVRRDVVEGLIAQGVTVLRYGGSMVNHPEYRWKKMIGPRDRRPPYTGTWYAYSTNGWGIIDFLNVCEAAGFFGIPAFHMDESPQDMADFVEYVNGPATSEWGQKRVADGHPAPYQLRHIQLGNEERVDEHYFAKFKPLAEAIWARDPDITLTVGDFVYGEIIRDPFQFGGAASRITTLAAHQRILHLAKEQQREVRFDLHIGTDGPLPDSTLAGTMSFLNALERLAEGAQFKVVVYELNSGNHSLRRALANAIAIQTIDRDGRIPIVTVANCLQPDGQNDNDWNQGLLFLNPSQVWHQPPGYVTQMFSQPSPQSVVACQLSGETHGLDVIAKRTDDGRTLRLQVVNPGEAPVSALVQLQGFAPKKTMASGLELSGPLAAVNTATQPLSIAPQPRSWIHTLQSGTARYTFPAYSITQLRIE